MVFQVNCCVYHVRALESHLKLLTSMATSYGANWWPMNATNIPQIHADDFSRRFGLRAANLMWLLGAGASASAGIPTAVDMIWDFKQRLFISQRRVSPKIVADLSNPVVRAQ